MTGRIIEEALKKVKTFIPNIDEISVKQVVLGLGYTGVKLSDGHAGLCYTFQDEIAQAAGHCQISDLAGTMAGRDLQLPLLRKLRHGTSAKA